jgi:hypothetical protein
VCQCYIDIKHLSCTSRSEEQLNASLYVSAQLAVFLHTPFPMARNPCPCLSNKRLSGDSDLDLNTSLNVDDDLFNDLGGGVQVDQTLVNAHLVCVPSLRSLSVGSLTGSDLELLGGETNRAFDAELLGLGAVDKLLADLWYEVRELYIK